jgi:hypothetical protein
MLTEQRKEFLEDILVTAIEGGIGYWSRTKFYKPSECKAIIKEVGDDGSSIAEFTITEDVILKSLNKIINRETEMYDEFVKTVLYADKYNDASEIDAEIADVIIQIGLFGEVVYG